MTSANASPQARPADRVEAIDAGPGIPDVAVLRVPEVARVLRCAPNTVYKAIAAGDLDAIHVGRGLRVSRVALLAYMGITVGDSPERVG